jgi:hypothetical protein
MFLLRVWDRFAEEKVSCALAGGFAVALHGAVRGTLDIDLVLKATAANFVAAEKALRNLGLESRIPVEAAEVFSFRREYIENRNMIAWSFVNPKDASEMVDLLLPFDLQKMKTESIPFQNRKLRVLSSEELIKMKSQTGRKQDLEDVRALKALRGKR